jgi:DeoR family transcriptional regulator, fructose operon transcriptional repressor
VLALEKKETVFAEERKNKILQLLNENKKLLVPELCDVFHVSPATIRNDLRELENCGLLQRTHGGALSNPKTRFELNSYQKEISQLTEKQLIARYSAGLVEDGDTIAIDTGTTTLEFAKMLGSKRDITVVTNDIQIASQLEQSANATVIFIGGILRKGFHCTVGPAAVRMLSEFSVDKAFMATNGISLEKGLTTPDMNQAEIKKAMIQIANEIIVLCDSSKFGNNAFVQVAPVSAISRIITDQNIDERDFKVFQSKDILVSIVGE